MLSKEELQFWIAYRILAARFWSHVDVRGADECWPWAGCEMDSGHGAFSVNGRLVHAHRVAYALSGQNFPEGYQVLHSCPGGDQPGCCNPRHLRAGTNAENQEDKRLRGGAKHVGGKIVLSYEIAEDIRAEYARGGITQLQLARKFGVTQRNIQKIIAREVWRKPLQYSDNVYYLKCDGRGTGQGFTSDRFVYPNPLN